MNGALIALPSGHHHGVGVPFTIGPLALRVVLLAAVSAVAGFALLRAFLPEPDRKTLAWIAALAATAVLVELMLAGELDIPSQATLLVLVALAMPLYLAVSQRTGPASGGVRRLAPWVLSLACGCALVEFARAWFGTRAPDTSALLLHTGLILALTGLSWFTIGVPRSRVVKMVVQVEAAVLATAAIAVAGLATVGV